MVQTIHVGGEVMGAPAYWNGHVCYFPSHDVLKDFAVMGDRLSEEPVAQSSHIIVDPGAIPTVSADGEKNDIV